MLEELQIFIDRINPSYSIHMPRLSSYLYGLERGVDQLIERNNRFVENPIPSVGIDYLNSLIVRADIPFLLRFKNDVERLIRVNNEYKSPVYSDFMRQYPVKEKAFIYSKKGRAVEYCLLTDDFDIIENLPLGSENSDDWKEVRPLRMLSNDSSEMLLDVTTSRLRYRHYPPKEAVFSVNVVKLLMVYTKYRQLFPEKFKENTDNYPFIYEYCILPLLKDNTKTLMLKILYECVWSHLYGNRKEYDGSELLVGEKSTFALGNRQSALKEINDLVTKCAQQKIKPDEVLISLYIGVGINLYDEIQWLMNSHYVGNQGIQFRYLHFIREYYCLSTLLGLYSLHPEGNRTKELKKSINNIIRRYQRDRFWTHAGNPYLAKGIEKKFEKMCMIIQ